MVHAQVTDHIADEERTEEGAESGIGLDAKMEEERSDERDAGAGARPRETCGDKDAREPEVNSDAEPFHAEPRAPPRERDSEKEDSEVNARALHSKEAIAE